VLAPEGAIPAILAAGLGGAGGSAVEQGVRKVANLPGAPSSVGEFAGEAGKEALLNAGGEGVGRIINGVIGRTVGRYFDPERLYQSALKPPPSMGSRSIQKVVNAGVKEGVPVNEQAAELATQKIDDLSDRVANHLAMAKSGVTVDPRAAVTGLQPLRDQFTQGSGDPAYLKAINKVEKNFLNRHPAPMAPADAQATKQALYKEVRLANQNAYKGGQPVGLDTQAKQEIADGLKSELENMFPEIKNLNQREGALIELRKALERFTNREGNKQLIPYFSTVMALGSAGAGALTGHATAGAEGGAALIGAQLVKSMLDNPEVKSKLAIALDKAGNTAAGRVIKRAAPYVPGSVIRIGADELRGAVAPNVKIGLPPPPQ